MTYNRFLQYFDEGGDVLPAPFKEAYDYLAPAPNTEYGSILPVARDTQTGANRFAMPSFLRDILLGATDLAAGTQTGELTGRGAATLLGSGIGAGSLTAPAGALATGAAGRLEYIKNLLSHGTTQEQRAVRNVEDYMRKTGNESYQIGDKENPNFLRSFGSPTESPLPKGYHKFMTDNADTPLYSAHAHPKGTSVQPSEGDLGVWSNSMHFPDTGYEHAYGLFNPNVGRQDMWIRGVNGPNDTLMMPAIRRPSNEYMDTGNNDRMQALRDMFAKRMMAHEPRTWDNPYWKDAHDFMKSEGAPRSAFTPNEAKELGANIRQGYTAGRVAEIAGPIYVDPNTRLSSVPALKNWTIGDVLPAYENFLKKRGRTPYARGGDV